jgi:hypothetical protein
MDLLRAALRFLLAEGYDVKMIAHKIGCSKKQVYLSDPDRFKTARRAFPSLRRGHGKKGKKQASNN